MHDSALGRDAEAQGDNAAQIQNHHIARRTELRAFRIRAMTSINIAIANVRTADMSRMYQHSDGD